MRFATNAFAASGGALHVLSTPLAALVIQWLLIALAVPTSIARDLLFDEAGDLLASETMPPALHRALLLARSLLQRDRGLVRRRLPTLGG